MFKRNHHVRIATVLQSLDPRTLMANECFFGGGTAIVLTHGEYRESIDIDFLCSHLEGYRSLREKMKNEGIGAICRRGIELHTVREIRADQYGIRTMLGVGGVEIKFEIVFEARVSLEHPGQSDQVCGVPTLTPKDMAVGKLLANSDRGMDRSVYCRDLIDLSMLNLPRRVLLTALEKASAAYGETVQKDLKKVIQSIKDDPDRLDDCMDGLKMDSVPKALVWERIRLVEKHLLD